MSRQMRMGSLLQFAVFFLCGFGGLILEQTCLGNAAIVKEKSNSSTVQEQCAVILTCLQMNSRAVLEKKGLGSGPSPGVRPGAWPPSARTPGLQHTTLTGGLMNSKAELERERLGTGPSPGVRSGARPPKPWTPVQLHKPLTCALQSSKAELERERLGSSPSPGVRPGAWPPNKLTPWQQHKNTGDNLWSWQKLHWQLHISGVEMFGSVGVVLAAARLPDRMSQAECEGQRASGKSLCLCKNTWKDLTTSSQTSPRAPKCSWRPSQGWVAVS